MPWLGKCVEMDFRQHGRVLDPLQKIGQRVANTIGTMFCKYDRNTKLDGGIYQCRCMTYHLGYFRNRRCELFLDVDNHEKALSSIQ